MKAYQLQSISLKDGKSFDLYLIDSKDGSELLITFDDRIAAEELKVGSWYQLCLESINKPST